MIHSMWITGRYMTPICLCELKITGKELLQKYIITVCYNAAHTSTAFEKKALIDKCLLLSFFGNRNSIFIISSF